MALSDLLLSPAQRKSRRLDRQILQQLTRIADALERLSPVTNAPLQDGSTSVEDVDVLLQAKAEVVSQTLRQRLGREPSDDEIMAELADVGHLL